MVDASIARVRAFTKEQGWAPSKFAELAGLHRNALRGMSDEDWQPNVKTLRALERVIAEHQKAAA